MMEVNPDFDISLANAGKHRTPQRNNSGSCCIDGIRYLSIHDMTTESNRPTALDIPETAQKRLASQLTRPCTKAKSISSKSDLTKVRACTVCACTGSRATKSTTSNICNLHLESITGEFQDSCNARNLSDANVSLLVHCRPGTRRSATPHTVQSEACKSRNICNEIDWSDVGSGANRSLCRHSFK